MSKLMLVVLISCIAVCMARNVPSLTAEDLEIIELIREKRQFGGQQYGQSSAAANANANSQQFGPNGFGASQAGAGAQSFQSQGPLGGFGASSSNAQSQGFQAGPGGIQGNAGFSGGQSYNLPGGHNVALTYGSGYNVGPDGRPSVSNSNSLAYTK